jgi:hypothetical protein
MWYHCLTRFIKGFLEGTHFLRPSTFSALEITLSCLVMCFPLSCRMCDDPSDWREHLKGIIPRTRFLRQQAPSRNGDGWDMLGMGHWPTWSTNPKKKKHDYKALMISNQIVTGQNSYCIYPSYLHVCHQDWHIMSVYRHITKWTYLHESYIPN